MDLAYWGFRRWPFERSFAADRFFAGSLHDEALARLLFLVEEFRRCGIVMGPAGTGKTFLAKMLQQRAERLGRLTVRCDATGLGGHELALAIAVGCHAPIGPDSSRMKIWSGLTARFGALAVIQQPLVVIIDHFDHVELSCQQTVYRLHQLADSVSVKLTVVIATQDHMIPATLQDVVELRIDTAPWTATECSHFINSSIAQAGSTEILFTDEAETAIFEVTNGVPANVVALSSLSLLAARGREVTLVTREIVEAASSEVFPRKSLQASRTHLVDEHIALLHATR